ncbi:hypothetical protein GCM10017562_02980 [Streptomyces roseofulvus]|uniref:hypothetical protein n=1 Tax=Streptomyces roseofulvus TaxID=33902 RepID=UPI0031F84A65
MDGRSGRIVAQDAVGDGSRRGGRQVRVGETSQFRARSLDEAVELAEQESAEYAREDGLDIIVRR